jgi:hypothetical protein
MSWLKIEKNVELEFRIVSTHFVRLTSQQAGVPKPFQQNAAHFVQDCQHSLCSADFPRGGRTQTLSTLFRIAGFISFRRLP